MTTDVNDFMAKILVGNEDLDRLHDAVNDPAGTYIDANGNVVPNLRSRLDAIGYDVPVAFTSAISVLAPTTTVTYNGQTYAADPAAVPFTTTSTFDGSQWVLIQSTSKFITIADMASSVDAIDSQTVCVIDAFNGEPEGFIYNASSTLSTNGATVVDATGMGVGRWISTRTTYLDFADMSANIVTRGDGTAHGTRIEGFSYIEDSSSPLFVNGVGLSPQPLSGIYHLESFGAACDGVTDDATAFQLAMDFIQSIGGGALLWEGVCRIETTITVAGYNKPFWLLGSGTLKTDVDDIRLIVGILGTPVDVVIDGPKFIGAWEDNQKQSTSEAWLVQIDNADHITVKGCEFRSSQKGGLKGYANNVTVRDNLFYEIARGGANMASSFRSVFSGNRFIHLGDDAISLHTTARSQNVTGQPYGHIVTGNYFEDTQGIAALGSRDITITNNVGVRVRSWYVHLGYGFAFDEGSSSSVNVTIHNNTCEDMVNYRSVVGDGSLCNFIILDFKKASDGGTLGGLPGWNDPAVGSIVPFYGNNRDIGAGEVCAGAWSISVQGNTFTKTLPAVTNYSDWGVGQMFDFDGYIDPAVSDGQLRPRIYLNGGVNGMSFHGNTLMGISSVRFGFDEDDVGFRGVRFTNNRIWDASENVIDTNASSNGLLDVLFEGNEINGDPFYTNSGRSDDGSWSGQSDLIAFNLQNTYGAQIRNNHIWNVSFDYQGSAVSEDNFLYGQMEGNGFSVNNKGIGRINGDGARGSVLVDWDADTTSATWGQIQHLAYTQASSIPTSGYYIRGMFIKNTGTSSFLHDGNGMLLTGWIRRTAGNGHSVGADWDPVYSSVNSPAT